MLDLRRSCRAPCKHAASEPLQPPSRAQVGGQPQQSSNESFLHNPEEPLPVPGPSKPGGFWTPQKSLKELIQENLLQGPGSALHDPIRRRSLTSISQSPDLSRFGVPVKRPGRCSCGGRASRCARFGRERLHITVRGLGEAEPDQPKKRSRRCSGRSALVWTCFLPIGRSAAADDGCAMSHLAGRLGVGESWENHLRAKTGDHTAEMFT